jgi:hypothetical protein
MQPPFDLSGKFSAKFIGFAKKLITSSLQTGKKR